MSTIQNLKNFIRHGKQARAANPPHGDPTTTVSPVHAQPQRHAPPATQNKYAISDPALDLRAPPAASHPGGDFSAANVDQRNVAAQATAVAARAVADKQDKQRAANAGSTAREKELDPSVIERIVAEERETQGKLPKYPGLERWTLLEKMGDGAFSNVYRAKDTTGQLGEVAIKVVRKFEMNSSQVSRVVILEVYYFVPIHFPFTIFTVSCKKFARIRRNLCRRCVVIRPTTTSIRISKSNPRLSRCAENFYYVGIGPT